MSAQKARTGRPHWVIVDEAHQIFPQTPDASLKLPSAFPAAILITVSPQRLSRDILQRIDAIVCFNGTDIDALTAQLGAVPDQPQRRETDIQDGEALVWFRHERGAVHPVRVDAPRQNHRRHLGKYAVGNVGEWHSFYFRGPDGKGGLRARNVWEFAHLCRDVDDSTWAHHLRAHDYSKWLRDVIKDDELADTVEKIEGDTQAQPNDSRIPVSRMLLSRYAAPSA